MELNNDFLGVVLAPSDKNPSIIEFESSYLFEQGDKAKDMVDVLFQLIEEVDLDGKYLHIAEKGTDNYMRLTPDYIDSLKPRVDLIKKERLLGVMDIDRLKDVLKRRTWIELLNECA